MLAPGTQLGPYRIVAPLGAGGMGEVYRAHDSRLGRDVAIKVLPQRSLLSPDARARFEREARTISQLSHPHICTLYDVGREGETEFLVMELLEGETLAHRIARGALPVADVLRLGAEIASALDRAHAAGVVHRDLKPGNVMLTKSGAKLMDFGLARVGAAPGSASGAALTTSPTMTQPLTSEGAIVGTFQYMAPEQLEGHEADARADIWALGCVLYEMATGKHAFAASTQASLISAIMRDEPRPIAELQPLMPPALQHVVARCLAKDPADRWQSARDVASVLEMTRGNSGVAPAVAGAAPQPRRRSRALLAMLAVMTLAVAALVTWSVTRPRLVDPARLKFTRLTLQRGTLYPARFGPDGKTVFYCASWEGRPPETFEVRPGFLDPRPLGLVGAGLRSVSSKGELAVVLGQESAQWTRWGALATVPLSGGVPRRVLEGVNAADWSPDGSTLVVTHQVGGMERLEMPPGHVLRQTAASFSTPRVSRDGRHIAVIETTMPSEHDSRGRVVVLDMAGRVVARTEEWNMPSGFAWSADGREVWYCGSQDVVSTDLRALSLDGHERVVARLDGYAGIQDINRNGDLLLIRVNYRVGVRGRSSAAEPERELSWYDASSAWDVSSDGRAFVFQETGIYGGPLYAVCMRGLDGGSPVKLGTGGFPSLSPNGTRVVCIQLGLPQRLLLLPTAAGDTLSLARGPIERYHATGWLPDGAHVVFVGSEPGRAQRTYVQDLSGGLPRPVTAEGVAGTRVSADGRWLAAVSADRRLLACPLDGGEPKFVATLGSNEQVVQWTADGRAIYVADHGTSMSVSRIDVATGRRTAWSTLRLPDPAGVSIVYLALSPDGGSYAMTYGRMLNDLYLVTGLK